MNKQCCEKCEERVQPYSKVIFACKNSTCKCHQEECNCEEMSCQEGCVNKHTHKGFWCHICHPERYTSSPTQETLRDKISQILIKWGMPTRQVAINEILDSIIKEAEEMKKQSVVNHQHVYLEDNRKYNQAIDDFINLLSKRK